MGDVNPYEAPPAEVAPAKPSDPLAFPALGFDVFSALALIAGLLFIQEQMTAWHLATHQGRDPSLGPYKALQVAGWLFAISCLAFLCARCLRKRRWCWYVIAFSLFTCLPFSGFIMAPLGVLTLVRLRQKQVWNSFQAGSRQGLSSE